MEQVTIKNSFDTPAKVVWRPGESEETDIPAITLSDKRKAFFSKKGIKKYFREVLPAKGDPAKEVVRKLVRSISFIVLIGSLVYLTFYYVNYRIRVSDNSGLISIFREYENLHGAALEKAWQEIKQQYPDVEFPEGMDIKFAKLYAMNQDVVGRLSIPGTNVNTVIVQGKDNNEYLYSDFNHKQSRYGMTFGGYNCSFGADGLSKNTIIYGHNTHDGLMFNQLTNYMSVDGYRKSPLIIFDSLYEQTYWKVFGVVLTNATTDLDNGRVFNCLYPEFSSDSAFMSVIDGINKRTMIKTDVDVRSDDNIMSLYTCYQNIFKGGRLIIFARQVRPGESTDVDTDSAYYNTSALFPQAYYDAKGYNNPYYSAPVTQAPANDTNQAQNSSGNNSAVGDVLF